MLMVCAGLLLSGCGADLTSSRYDLELPEIPPAWASVLGSPQWKIEWLNPGGEKTAIWAENGQKPEISLPQTWASAVTAWPSWPDKGIAPGTFKPAGAVFPFDAKEQTLVLSWRGGVDSVLYWELAKAAGDVLSQRAAARLPCNFNWPRFRELCNDPAVNAQIRADPWLADWPSIAAKTIASGFDKRRLVPEATGEITVPVSAGPWIGVSPFAPPLLFSALPSFPAGRHVSTWVSAQGILRCTAEAWILAEWE